MKKFTKLLIVAILCTVCLSIVACGKIDSIYFEKEPRTTYVQGQEFTLDDAVINALTGNKSSAIDINEVTYTGYNSEQLGEQTVTVSYQEKTLTLKVKVIPRITFEGVTREYFVGDILDKNSGRIRVADDNANVKSVNMSDTAVTVTGFESTTEGTKTLTVSYGEYTGTFTVNVYTAETVELTSQPRKNTYYSYDTEFLIKGANFTVTANNGSLTRTIEATMDIVEIVGFDPSAAGLEHMDNPLKQTVKIKYLDTSFDFKITVRFSGVTLIQMRSEELKNVTPATATKEQKEMALDALHKYVDLTGTEKELISSDVIQKLLDIGVTYGAELFAKEAEDFSDTIKLEVVKDAENNRLLGKITITATTYDAVKTDLARLEEEDEPLLVLAGTLYNLKNEFYRRKIDDKSIDEILGTVFNPKDITDVTKAFKHLIELHEILLIVPENWDKTTINNFGDDIRRAVATINGSDYNAYDGSSTLYSILSSWRPGNKNDYFDIIYAYYYYYNRENLVSTLWEKIYLPGPLQELFTMHNLSCQEAMKLSVGDDTAPFMYYYYRSNEIAEKIKSGDNQLHKELYNFINFDRLISAYLVFGTAAIQGQNINGIAYVYHASSMYGNSAYDELLDNFLEMFKLSLQNGFSFADENIQELSREVIKCFAALSPTERFAFISSLHCDYRITTSTELILSHTVNEDGTLTCYGYFTYLVFSCYKEALTVEAYDVFSRLVEASEMLGLRYHNSNLYNGYEDANGVLHLGFIDSMEDIIEDAAKLSDEEKASFSTLLAQLVAAYNELKTPSAPTLEADQAALFEELKGAIETFYAFYNIAISEDTDSDEFKYYIIAFSAYERAKAISAELRATNDNDVIKTLDYIATEFTIEVDENTATMNSTYDYMLDGIGGIVYLTMLRTEIEGYNVCTIYLSYEVSSFLNSAYDILVAEYNNEIDETYVDDILALMEIYNQLNDNQISTLTLLCATEYYFSAIEHCFDDICEEETLNVVNLLVEAERAYATYVAGSKKSADRAAFTEAFIALRNAYNALEDKASFEADFLNTYNTYLIKYNFFI